MGADHGNYSRLMFDENLRYIERRVQQGIPWVDADDNDAQDGHYTLMRRIQEILGDGAVEDGFKCVGTGLDNDFEVLGGGGTGDTAGRFFLNGHRCILYSDTTFKNIGANEDGKSVQPRITAIEYQSGPAQTLLTDSAANHGTDEHAGKTITPDITQPGSTYTIVSNTATVFTITGDATAVAQAGDNYRVEMTTPTGSDRDDGVFLNVYVDEYDCDDDPNLKHNLSTQVCAQLRLKLIQTIHIQEGAETFSDYVDADGKQHYVFQIARIHRYDGVDAIWDIDDLRPILNDGVSSYWSLFLLGNNLRAIPTDPEANTVDIMPGWWTLSDRSALKKFPTQTTSPTFNPIVTPGNVRYDLISMADNATLSVVQGSEVALPGDPFTDGPPPEGNKLALAFVRITETGTPSIDPSDITDAREFLNIGLGADALTNYYAALWLRPHEQDTPNATIRIEPGRYVNSDRSAMINKASAFNTGAFAVVGTPGNDRFDLVMMDDSGNPQIIQGTEVASPGDPFTDSPAPDNDKLLVAIVKVDETATVVVDAADVTDAREFLNSGGALGTKVTQSEIDIYRPHTQTTPNTTVRIEAGQHIKSDGTSAVVVGAAFNSGVFAVVGGGLERYDLLAMDDSGNPQIIQGTPVPISTGNPLTDAPDIPLDQLAIAIVKVDETVTVVVDTTDITDIREFLNKGSGLQIEDEGNPLGAVNTINFTGAAVNTTVLAGVATVAVTGGGGGGGATQLYEKHIATANQTLFTLTTGDYVIGNDTLFVFRNGKKLVKITEYTETSTTSITIINPAIVGDVFEFIVPAASSGEGECYKRDDFVATANQTVFLCSNTAPPDQANTMVLSGGVLMLHGASNDYTFSGNDLIFNTGRSLDEKVATIKVLCGGGGTCCGGLLNYEKEVATLGQTVFDLGFTYVLGSERLQLFVNGVKQVRLTDYVETDTDTITFLVGLNTGDIVEFFYLGANDCADVRCPAPTVYDKQTSTQDQVQFNLSQSYQVGTNTLWVFRNGVRLTTGIDYTEVNASRVDMLIAVNAGEEFVFIQMGEVGDTVVTARQEFTSTIGQTAFNLSFSYVPGTNDLFVWSGGVLMRRGASDDYVETDPTTITFNVGRGLSEQVDVVRIGAQTASAMKLWEKHLAVQDQILFNLTGTYLVGGRSLQVFRNGQLQTPVDDYTETNEQTVTLQGYTANADDVYIFMVAGGDVVSCRDGGILSYEKHTSAVNQSVFNVGFNFTMGGHGLLVTRNGNVQTVDVDYTETSESQVTFTSGLYSGDVIEFRNFSKVVGPTDGVLNYKLFDGNVGQLTVGQTVITLPFRYNPGSHMLRVNRNGSLLAEGIEYTETDANTITLATQVASSDEWLEAYTIAQAKTGSRAHTIAYHDDGALMMAPGQTYRDLVVECTSNTQVVIKADTKVLADNWETYINFVADVTVDITTIGVANGLDQGADVINTWYYLHAIKNTVTGAVAGLLSLSPTSPLLPTGYDVHRLVGALRNDGSGHLLKFYQQGESVNYNALQSVVSALYSATWSSISCASYIPPITRVGRFLLQNLPVTNVNQSIVNLGFDGSNTARHVSGSKYGGSYSVASGISIFEMPTTPVLWVYHYENGTAGRAYLSVVGFVLSL